MKPGEVAREAGLRSVVLAGHRGDTATARAGIEHDHPTIRAAALGALERLRDLRPTDLQSASRDRSPLVRRRAAEAAIGLREQQTLEALLDDVDSTVVETAAWALGELDPGDRPAVGALRAVAATHEDALCREAAVAALGAIGDPEGLSTILTALDDKATVRRRAVIALAAFEGPGVDAALSRSLDDRDAQVRQVAEDLLDPNR